MQAALITRCAQLASKGWALKEQSSTALSFSQLFAACHCISALFCLYPPPLLQSLWWWYLLSSTIASARTNSSIVWSSTAFFSVWRGLPVNKSSEKTIVAAVALSEGTCSSFSVVRQFPHHSCDICAFPALIQMRLLSSLKQQMAGSSTHGCPRQRESERRQNFPPIRVVTNSPPKATKVQTIRHDDDYLEARTALGPGGMALEESFEAHREAAAYARPITSTKYEATSPLSPRPSTRSYSVTRRRAGTIGSVDSGPYLPSPTSTTANSISSTGGLLDTAYHQLPMYPLTPISPKSPAPAPIPPCTPSSRRRRAGTLTGMPSAGGHISERLRSFSNDSVGSPPAPLSIGSPPCTTLHSAACSVVSVSPTGTRSPPIKLESRPPSSKRAHSQDTNVDDNALRGAPPRDDWDIVVDRIREYRATHEAPVDTVGCEALTEEEPDPKLRRFRSLVSLMLSAQTKDEITAEAVRNLSQRLPGGLSPKSLSAAPIDLVHECVRRVGFWQRKSNYIKEAARTCLEQYAGDIPRTVPQLLSLPGVGPKMAYLTMHAAWHDTQGIGVDTHVDRISHRLGWVAASAKTPEATRHALESWLPRSLWREINPMLVGLGQTVCRAIGPKCAECPVANFCPSAKIKPSSARTASHRSKDRPIVDFPPEGDDASAYSIHSVDSHLENVDVEDLASILSGAEHAVRSRKLSATTRRPQPKTAFPQMPNSPAYQVPPPQPLAASLVSPAAATIDDTEEKPLRSLRRRRPPMPPPSHELPALPDTDAPIVPKREHSNSWDPESESEQSPKVELKNESPGSRTITPSASQYFMRSRSNAASEEVRPEAKTDAVMNARAKVRNAKLYSRRLSKSDMQWALGEDWDPDNDSSLSDLSDLDFGSDADAPLPI